MKKYYCTLAFYKSSKGDKYYTVKVDQDGGLSCNCPRWLYHVESSQRVCKHVILAREEFGEVINGVKEHGLSVVESPFLTADY